MALVTSTNILAEKYLEGGHIYPQQVFEATCRQVIVIASHKEILYDQCIKYQICDGTMLLGPKPSW